MDWNYDLLEETKKEIRNLVFFKEKIEISTEEYDVIYDFEQACCNAFSRTYKYKEYKGQTWVDILEENMAKVKGIIYRCDNYAELSKVLRSIEIPELMEIKYTVDDYSIQEEMENEIELCAKSRFVCGKENAFFESLFKAYKLGGWPCGWNDGKIIVYVPDNN
ncbi:MAG: hypothetical protein HDT39_00070 [Lachnospiraceae bacterium]|nr:hypothetical protein [Lachnospiraceae bacterium]